MGTETMSLQTLRAISEQRVKLNNPPMGTETIFRRYGLTPLLPQ